MSVVTCVILSVSLSEGGCGFNDGDTAKIDNINSWIAANSNTTTINGPLWEISDHAGGSKRPQAFIFIGGLNHLREEEFVDFLRTIDWDEPEDVVLVMMPEQEATRVWRPLSIENLEAGLRSDLN